MLRRVLLVIYKNLNNIFIGVFIILSTLFLFLLCFENITKTPTKSVEIFENRNLATFPKFSKTSWDEYTSSLSNYFSDNLPLRTQMIRSYRRLWVDCLPPLLNPIIKGTDGHKFARMTILNYQGYERLSVGTLRSKKVYLVGQNAFWEYYGADFYSLFVPDKPNIYTTNLFEWVGESRGCRKQIVEYLSDLNKYGVTFTDLTPILIQNLDRGLLYNKESDLLHWNGLGLAVAYEYLVELLSDNESFTQKIDLDAFEIVPKKMETDTSITEEVPWMVLNTENITLVENDYRPDMKQWKGVDIAVNSNVKTGTLLFVTDSCIKKAHQDRLGSSHAALFPTVHHVNKQINSHIILGEFDTLKRIAKEHKPDIVIEEFVEWLRLSHGSYMEGRKTFFLAGSMVLGEKQIVLDPEYIRKNIKNIKTDQNIKWVDLEGNEGKVRLNLTSMMPDEEGVLVLVARIYSSDEAKAVLYYSQQGNARAKPLEISRLLKKGVDYLYIPIYGEPGKPIHMSFELSGAGQGYKVYPFPKTVEEFLKEVD